MSNIHFSLREDDLYEFFGEKSLNILKLNVLKNEKGQSKGSGFVEFENAKDANYAVNKLNGFNFSGRAISLEFAKINAASGARSNTGGNRY
jgi:RNA recognition motif-containing protein